MTDYCQDRDLLAIEPVLFTGIGLAGQQLIAGNGGQLAGTAFSISGGSFVTTSVQAGMVLGTYETTPSEGMACEITAVSSATQLTVSVLRADTEAPAIPPPSKSNVSYQVVTYAAQIKAVSRSLGEKLRQLSEASAISEADFADSAQLRSVTAYGALTEIFVARADNAERYDANWIKAQHYRQLFRQNQLQLRLAVDTDGNGHAEYTRSLGNVLLKRR